MSTFLLRAPVSERRVLGAVRGREGASGPDLDGAVRFGSVI